MKHELKRRDFMKISAAGTAAGVCSNYHQQSPQSGKFRDAVRIGTTTKRTYCGARGCLLRPRRFFDQLGEHRL